MATASMLSLFAVPVPEPSAQTPPIADSPVPSQKGHFRSDISAPRIPCDANSYLSGGTSGAVKGFLSALSPQHSSRAGRLGQGLTAEKMKECVWLRPEAVARFDFLEWTGADYLRHTKFVAMRNDKDPEKVAEET
jgi:hypothetical protein